MYDCQADIAAAGLTHEVLQCSEEEFMIRPAKSKNSATRGAPIPFGALAIGRLAIGRMRVGRAKIKSLEIGELTVKRLRVSELVVNDSLELPRGALLENGELD
jgi:hypothetical protein